MRILHTADLHLGRSFKGQNLADDQSAILDQVIAAIEAHRPDVLIIAGDLYDRAAPPASAVAQFGRFLDRASQNTAIVAIAGNHDSGERVGFGTGFWDKQRFLVRGPLRAEEPPLILNDVHGPVAISALPYGEIYSARRSFEDESINSPADVLTAQIAAARRHVPEGARWVVTAHAFVSGAVPSETERPLSVGGVETVPYSLFEGAAYVALGHLHRPQTAGAEHIRYSGAPLAYGFDESGQEKSMALVELGPEEIAEMTLIPFHPLRAVRKIEGKLNELIETGLQNPSDDFICAVLTDEGALVDPMARLREAYPNALELYRKERSTRQNARAGGATASLSDPTAVVSEFVNYLRDEPPDEDEAALITKTLEAVLHEET